jgi:hypothetical protein
MQEDLAAGRCVYCGIFKELQPSHDCLSHGLTEEIVIAWVERIIL